MTPVTTVFDSHLHIIDPRYPLSENDGYLPPAFTAQDYRRRVEGLNVGGGAVVSGSFQGFDQTYLRDALRELGPTFVGVTQIPAETADQEIVDLDAAGVRAVRFNVRRGGSADLDDLDYLARRVYDLVGWHTELYIDSRCLAELTATLQKLPRISIDHLGLSAAGLPDLLRAVDAGAYVKATGFGRIDLDPAEAIRQILAINPGALVFGTDLPSTRADRPFRDGDVAVIQDAVGDDRIEDVLWRNAETLYRIDAKRLDILSDPELIESERMPGPGHSQVVVDDSLTAGWLSPAISPGPWESRRSTCGFGLTLLGAIPPAFRAARLNIVDAVAIE